MQVQNPILAYYVNIYMYKIQISTGMRKKMRTAVCKTLWSVPELDCD